MLGKVRTTHTYAAYKMISARVMARLQICKWFLGSVKAEQVDRSIIHKFLCHEHRHHHYHAGCKWSPYGPSVEPSSLNEVALDKTPMETTGNSSCL
ncbi:hypothetical protein EYR41_001624 [Orbilia oligospora]|uniref:Uncharacterized protein n=1 Tax=Orbilia oligospora TaxID=2813651 RepID=A0A8H2EF31_ORBOL|nr:hypothetical protein EYR41_001624 [Orbilia oligospora]